MRNNTRMPLLIGIFMILSVPALATNGMNVIGWDAASAGRGGATIGVIGDTCYANVNPAGMSFIQGRNMKFSLAFLMPDLQHSDVTGNNAGLPGKNDVYPIPLISYMNHKPDSDFAWGIGLMAQGGMGVNYRGKFNLGGNIDDIYSQVSYMKFMISTSWRISDVSSIGVTLDLGRSDLAFDYLPNTAFFKFENGYGYGWGLKIGYLYKPNDRFAAGLYYNTKSEIGYGGKVTFANNPGQLGPLAGTSMSADFKGFGWPQSFGVGFMYHFNEFTMIAMDVKQYYWSETVDAPYLAAGGAVFPFPMNWDDQTVIALGLEQKLNPKWTLRIGYNHGGSPVPDATLNPLFPAVSEDHYTLGLGYRDNDSVAYHVAIETSPRASQTNPTPPPAGLNNTESMSQTTLHFGVSWSL